MIQAQIDRLFLPCCRMYFASHRRIGISAILSVRRAGNGGPVRKSWRASDQQRAAFSSDLFSPAVQPAWPIERCGRSILGSPVLFAQAGFIHASGKELVDGVGKPLVLRGTNLGNWFEPEGYMFHLRAGARSPREIEELSYELIGPGKADAFWKQWRETYITEADIDRIKEMGFNSVRVPIHWKFFDQDATEGFRLLGQLIQWARKDHIYIIIDLHCAPGGQTGTNIDDSYGYAQQPISIRGYVSRDRDQRSCSNWSERMQNASSLGVYALPRSMDSVCPRHVASSWAVRWHRHHAGRRRRLCGACSSARPRGRN